MGRPRDWAGAGIPQSRRGRVSPAGPLPSASKELPWRKEEAREGPSEPGTFGLGVRAGLRAGGWVFPAPGVPARSAGGRGRTMAGSGAPRFVRRAAQTAASSGRHGDGTRRLRAPRGLQAEPRAALPGLRARLGGGSRPPRGRPGRGAGGWAGRPGRVRAPSSARVFKRMGRRRPRPLPWVHTAGLRGAMRGWGPGMYPPPRHQGCQAAEETASAWPFVSGADSGHTCGSQALDWATPPPFLPLPRPCPHPSYSCLWPTPWCDRED